MSIFGGSLVAGEADDGVVSVGTSGGSNTVGTGGLASNCEVAVFLNAVTYTIGGVGGESGLLGEGDDDGVVLAKFAIAIGVTANDGAVVNISSSDFFGVGTGDDGVESYTTTIVFVGPKDGGDSGTSVVEIADGRSNELDTTDNPTFGDNIVGGVTGVDHVTGFVVLNVFSILGDIPAAATVNEAIEPMVGGVVSQHAIVVTPTIVTVGLGSDIVVHGVVGEVDIAALDLGEYVVVANGAGGQVRTGTVRDGSVAIPTAIIHRVGIDPTVFVDDDTFGSGDGDALVVVFNNRSLGVLSGIEVVEGSGDVVADVGTVVLNEGVPSGVDLHALGNQAIVTFDIVAVELTHTVGGAGKDGDIVDYPPIAVSIASVLIGHEPTDADAEVGLTGSSDGQGVGEEATDSGVDSDIDTIDIDFDGRPGGTVGGVVDVAFIVVLTIVLIESHIDGGSSGGINAIDFDESIDSTGVGSVLLVGDEHHETVITSVGLAHDAGTHSIAETRNTLVASKSRNQTGIDVGKGSEVCIGETVDTTPSGEGVVHRVCISTTSDNTSSVIHIGGMEVDSLQGISSILGEDGAVEGVLDHGSIVSSLNLLAPMIRGCHLCESERCAQGKS